MKFTHINFSLSLALCFKSSYIINQVKLYVVLKICIKEDDVRCTFQIFLILTYIYAYTI